jgi:hypothetical protein
MLAIGAAATTAAMAAVAMMVNFMLIVGVEKNVLFVK